MYPNPSDSFVADTGPVDTPELIAGFWKAGGEGVVVEPVDGTCAVPWTTLVRYEIAFSFTCTGI